MPKNHEKTNAMRILDSLKADYAAHFYQNSGAVSGTDVAKTLNENPDAVFKTLVTAAPSKTHYVFLVPVSRELDLKKAAKCVGEKKIEMIKSKELLPLTGYIHGGCSPLGMKKPFKTVIDKSAQDFAAIFFSGGKIGFQIEISLTELRKALSFTLEDITV